MTARAAATALLLSLLACSPALAADRDRDRMPDRWEKRHKLSKPRADQDRDGLRNRDEYRAKTNPRKRDSDRDGLRDGDEIRFGWSPRKRDTDRDGIRDGKENSGVVVAVAGQRVTIKLVKGGRLSGRLDDPEALACVTVPAPGSSGTGDSGPLPDGEEPTTEDDFDWDPAWGEKPADLDTDEDEDAPELARAAQSEDAEDVSFEAEEDAAEAEDDAAETGENCTAALRVGALVHEAVAERAAGGRRLTLLRLVAERR